MSPRELHDGREDGLRPLESLDLGNVAGFEDLVRAMGDTAFGGRQLGDAFEILTTMVEDADCTCIMTISGAMTVAKQGRIICDLIDRGCVQALVVTGALMAHGLTEAIGLAHYRHDPLHNDRELFEKGVHRIYDTLEMESNLNDVETMIVRVLDEADAERDAQGWSSASFCRAIGKRLDELDQGPGVLRSAWRKGVPVFVPAFTDSELGLDFALWAVRREMRDRDLSEISPDDLFSAVPSFNPFLDLQEYARLIGHSNHLGIFTIGGGVPRNWAQQVAPYFDIANHRLKAGLKVPRFRYGVRICPEPVHWGGLSGCTYSEGVSWGKFMSKSEGGRFAEVFCDATLVLPLLAKAIFEHMDRPAS